MYWQQRTSIQLLLTVPNGEPTSAAGAAKANCPGRVGGRRTTSSGILRRSDNCLEYESNPKHKEPWQPGRKGSLCPPETRDMAVQLLLESELVGTRRYAVYAAKAYCAMQHADDVWHGYP